MGRVTLNYRQPGYFQDRQETKAKAGRVLRQRNIHNILEWDLRRKHALDFWSYSNCGCSTYEYKFDCWSCMSSLCRISDTPCMLTGKCHPGGSLRASRSHTSWQHRFQSLFYSDPSPCGGGTLRISGVPLPQCSRRQIGATRGVCPSWPRSPLKGYEGVQILCWSIIEENFKVGALGTVRLQLAVWLVLGTPRYCLSLKFYYYMI